jgi:hypothetical protein
VGLHGLLHVEADLGRWDLALAVANLVEVGNGILALVGLELGDLVTGLVVGRNRVCARCRT